MNAIEAKTQRGLAADKFLAYLATGLAGFFVQGWDRMNAIGFDVDLRREPTEANARALLWTATERQSPDEYGYRLRGDEELDLG